MPSVSIIVPVLNEALTMDAVLNHLARTFPDCELIVVDGGSSDHTVATAQPYAMVIISERGRARQMNTGAKVSSGDILWFVHADSYVYAASLSTILQTMENPAVVGGGLTLQFQEATVGLRMIAALSNLRARWLHWIFGDQSLFVRRHAFEAVGGFPLLPIMEDLEISRRLKRIGQLVLLPTTSQTSARRFLENGTGRTFLRMQLLKIAYFLGMPPEDLVKHYAKTMRREKK